MASPVLTEEERAEGDSAGGGEAPPVASPPRPAADRVGKMSSFRLIPDPADGASPLVPRPAGTERQKSF